MLTLVLLMVGLMAPPEPRGVSETAKDEILRRGNYVEVVGDDERSAPLEIMGPPSDDSCKFSLTVVYGKNQNSQLNKLKADLLAADENALAPWVKCKDKARWTYDVESVADSCLHVTFQQHKSVLNPRQFDKVKIESYPTILLQAPRCGKYGPPGAVVNQRNYYASADDLSKWLRETMLAYSQSDVCRDAMRQGGHQQKAPFEVLPKELPIGADPPAPFPPDLFPTTPAGLTVEQIKQAVLPDVATDAFILAQLQAKPASVEAVKIAWLLQKQPVKEPPPSQFPILTILFSLLGGAGLGIPLGMALLKIASGWFSGYSETTPSKVDDVMADLIAKVVAELEKKQSAKA